MSGFDANTKIQFSQSTGIFTMNTTIGDTKMVSIIGTGWSGNGEGKKNPAMEGVKDVGPTPSGVYRIGNPGKASTGEYSMRLAPANTAQLLGRDNGMIIHGPASGPHAKHQYGQESTGCPILDRPHREIIGRRGVRKFEVVE